MANQMTGNAATFFDKKTKERVWDSNNAAGKRIRGGWGKIA